MRPSDIDWPMTGCSSTPWNQDLFQGCTKNTYPPPARLVAAPAAQRCLHAAQTAKLRSADPTSLISRAAFSTTLFCPNRLTATLRTGRHLFPVRRLHFWSHPPPMAPPPQTIPPNPRHLWPWACPSLPTYSQTLTLSRLPTPMTLMTHTHPQLRHDSSLSFPNGLIPQHGGPFHPRPHPTNPHCLPLWHPRPPRPPSSQWRLTCHVPRRPRARPLHRQTVPGGSPPGYPPRSRPTTLTAGRGNLLRRDTGTRGRGRPRTSGTWGVPGATSILTLLRGNSCRLGCLPLQVTWCLLRR